MRTRKQQIEFHVKSGDYFGSLAAIIDLVNQSLEKDSQQIKILDKLKNDLIFLQKNYQITRKQRV